MRITAVIVSYNSADVISAALRCVYNHPRVAQCIVVDNASGDSTLELVRTQFPRVRLLNNRGNYGFAAACNQALELVATEFSLLLNPDATIASEAIELLLEYADSCPNAAIIAPLIEGNDHYPTTKALRGSAIEIDVLPTPMSYDNPRIISASFVSGAIALWRMQQMRQVGFFDPAFFLFYEDDDISIRTRRAGYDLLLVKGLDVRHEPGHACPVTKELLLLRMQSSQWSLLYLHKKYRGFIAAKWKALCIFIGGLRKRYKKYPEREEDWNASFALLEDRYKGEVEKVDAWLEKRLQEFKARELAAADHHNRRREEVLKALEAIDMEDLPRRRPHEKQLDDYHADWMDTVQKHEDRWREVEKEYANARMAVSARHEDRWNMLSRRREAWLMRQWRQKENEDILVAVKYFLRNSRRFWL
ncbi:MAG: glycosyltransferase family 2 protein [Alphaproteobacteria bacterium]|nr:glycosyltransferase family 2 protein [Alphaproteobacteria bacterium]